MRDFFYERMAKNLPVTSVFVIPWIFPGGKAVDDLTYVIECTEIEEWHGEVRFFPLLT